MKVGSLVECVVPQDTLNALKVERPNIHWPDSKCVYTIRGFDWNGYLYLEEIINTTAPNGLEWAFNSNGFRELQPPMDLTELLEETITA